MISEKLDLNLLRLFEAVMQADADAILAGCETIWRWLRTREGRIVAMAGDGINDAIALQQADLSISLRGASTIATDTAQIVLMDVETGQKREIASNWDRSADTLQWSRDGLSVTATDVRVRLGPRLWIDAALGRGLHVPSLTVRLLTVDDRRAPTPTPNAWATSSRKKTDPTDNPPVPCPLGRRKNRKRNGSRSPK